MAAIVTENRLTVGEVQQLFAESLRESEWTVQLGVRGELIATRAGETLIVNAVGFSESPGTAIDEVLGRLLRRIGEPTAGVRYAIVGPTSVSSVVLRVHPDVRTRLGMAVYSVSCAGEVRELL